MTDHAQALREALDDAKAAQNAWLCNLDDESIYAAWLEAHDVVIRAAYEHAPALLAALDAVTAERDAAKAMAEQYRQIILMDAGASGDADDICCCGGKIGEGGSICAHGGCRSMADYYLATKLQALGATAERDELK